MDKRDSSLPHLFFMWKKITLSQKVWTKKVTSLFYSSPKLDINLELTKAGSCRKEQMSWWVFHSAHCSGPRWKFMQLKHPGFQMARKGKTLKGEGSCLHWEQETHRADRPDQYPLNLENSHHSLQLCYWSEKFCLSLQPNNLSHQLPGEAYNTSFGVWIYIIHPQPKGS